MFSSQFISGLVHMMARSSGDHGDQDHRPSEEGKTSDGSLAGSRSASADPMRQSLDSQAQTHKPSVSTVCYMTACFSQYAVADILSLSRCRCGLR
jgi:hypothetical protein